MSKVFEYKAGSLLDRVSGQQLTNSGVVFKQTEKGVAGISTSSNSVINAGRVEPIELYDYFSISLMIKDNGLGSAVIYEINSNNGISIQRSSSKYIILNIGGTIGVIRGPFDMNDNKWHLCTFVVDVINQHVKLYTDNVLTRISTLSFNSPTYNAQDLFIYSRNGVATTENMYIQSVKHYNHILTEQEINKEYKQFLALQNMRVAKTNFYYPNGIQDNDVIFYDDFRYENTDGTNVIPNDWLSGTGLFKFSELTEDDEVLSHLKKGTKILECTNAGTVSFPSKQAYGTWEFSVNSNRANFNYVYFIVNDKNDLLHNSYMVVITRTNAILFLRNNSSLFLTSNDYVEDFKMYRFKITRSVSGEFYVYIKGGSFGNNYVKVDVTGGDGYNPIIDTTTTISKYTTLNFDPSDKITNIKYTKGIVI